MYSAQHFWFENAKNGDFLVTCNLTGEKKIVNRNTLSFLDSYARGRANDSMISELVAKNFLMEEQPILGHLPKIAIAVTVKNPPAEFSDFLQIHSTNLCSKIYVFLDDPKENFSAPDELSHIVRVIREQDNNLGNSVYRDNLEFFKKEVMARQIWNAERALEFAAGDDIDWLFHLDEDEILILPEGPATLSTVPKTIGSLVVLNDEVVVTEMEYNSYIFESSLFKINPKLLPRGVIPQALKEIQRSHFYTAYTNGKSGVRIGAGACPAGVHRFRGPNNAPGKAYLPGARVLHFANCGFTHFYRKYFLRQNMSDKYFEKKKRIPIHLQARDALLEGGKEGLEKYFKENIYFSRTEADLLSSHDLIQKWSL